MKTTKVFLDTEFTGLHKNTTLISIGLVSECGKTFYAEFTDYDRSQVDEWIQTNVINNLSLPHHLFAAPSLPGFPKNERKQYWEKWTCGTGEELKTINAVEISARMLVSKEVHEIECIGTKEAVKNRLEKWLDQFEKIEIWCDVLAYDWVLFCDLWENAMGIPQNIFYIPFDLSTFIRTLGIDPNITREKLAHGEHYAEMPKHNALWDAQTAKLCFEKLNKNYLIQIKG